MTWSPWQKQKNSQMDVQEMHSEYDLAEGEDKITLLPMFQQNQLEDVRANITVWLTSLAIQINKLKKLNHVLDEEYQITHIVACLLRECSSVVEQVKIDRRTGSTLTTMDEIRKRLKERYQWMKKIMRMGKKKISKNQRILMMMKEKLILEQTGSLKNPKEPTDAVIHK